MTDRMTHTWLIISVIKALRKRCTLLEVYPDIFYNKIKRTNYACQVQDVINWTKSTFIIKVFLAS